jgi:hypothetical protein
MSECRVFLVCLVLLPGLVQAGVSRGVDPQTGLKFWKLQQQGLSLELRQRLPDQTRAFFQARGFARAIADRIATACVLQTIGGHHAPDGPAPVHIDLAEWRVITPDGERPPKLKSRWDAEWAPGQVSRAARIAFRWATFPTVQTFSAGGDYGWGMISFDLPPGSHFDLRLRWRQGGQAREARIDDIECPADEERP